MAKKHSEIGKEKTGHIFSRLDIRWKGYVVPRLPKWIDSKKLTLSTLLWSLLVIICGYLAKNNILWLWAVSFLIILQYITDVLDGALGRYRNEGFIKWGYYMDKLLDWVFVCSVLIGYSFILPDRYDYMLFYAIGVYGAFMIHSCLYYTTAKKYKVSFYGVGPTELRLAFIIGNTLVIFFGRIYMERGLPYLLGGVAVLLFVVMYITQKELRKMDMGLKKKSKKQDI